MAKVTMKALKGLGWDYIGVGGGKPFSGAVTSYQSSEATIGKVAVGFNEDEAFVLEDEQGLFEASDLQSEFKRDPEGYLESTGTIEGLTSVAWIADGVVEFNEAKLDELGINLFETKEDIRNRLENLAAASATPED